MEKKPGLYRMPFLGKSVVIDVYWSDDEQNWQYGRGADFGNVMTEADWSEIAYIGPVTDAYLTHVESLVRCQALD